MNICKPPKFAEFFISAMTRPGNRMNILGDLEEDYRYIRDRKGSLKAKLWYWSQIFRPLPDFIKNSIFWNIAMLKNYLKLSYRSLIKNKLFGIISIFCLSIAIGTALSLFSVINLVFNFDRFHKNADSIYLIENEVNKNGETELWGDSPVPLAPVIKNDFPQIERAVRISNRRGTFKYKDKVMYERFTFTDSEFLDMFTFPLISGDKQALKNGSSVILTEETAVRFFGERDPVGEQVVFTFDDDISMTYIVGGVAEKLPLESTFGFSVLVPYNDLINTDREKYGSWGTKAHATFIQVKYPSDAVTVESGMDRYLQIMNETEPDWPVVKFMLDPLLDMSANSRQVRNSISHTWNPAAMITFILIGVFILLLACFNYINIAIVSSAGRLKEIGLRKVMGSSRFGIIKQFLGENFLVCFLALAAGVFLAQTLFLPVMDRFTDGDLPETVFVSRDMWLIIPGILLFTGICGGAYPSFFISRFQPVRIFRKNQNFGGKGILRKSLIIFQFVLTFILISFSVYHKNNKEYQKTIDWGYDKNNTIVVPVNGQKHFAVFNNEIVKNPDIAGTAGSEHHIGRSLKRETIEYKTVKYEVRRIGIGWNYLDLMKVRLKKGRLFDKNRSMDTDRSVIINEKFAEYMEWQDPVGKHIRMKGNDYYVTGVVCDFHYDDFWNEISPVLFNLSKEEDYNYISVKIKPGTEAETILFLKNIWKEQVPDKPYMGFVQDGILDLYFRSEDLISSLFSFYASIALIISCMGLFGLVSISITKRMKEISIRKVLGANLFSIFKLMNREYLLLLTISSVIAAPLSYKIIKSIMDSMNQLYHVPVSAIYFIITFIMIIVTAAFTVSSLLYKAANTNPVDSLRDE